MTRPMSDPLQVTLRRTLEGRLVWFRVEHADGLALEVKARVDTTAAEMELARLGAIAMLGASHA